MGTSVRARARRPFQAHPPSPVTDRSPITDHLAWTRVRCSCTVVRLRLRSSGPTYIVSAPQQSREIEQRYRRAHVGTLRRTSREHHRRISRRTSSSGTLPVAHAPLLDVMRTNSFLSRSQHHDLIWPLGSPLAPRSRAQLMRVVGRGAQESLSESCVPSLSELRSCDSSLRSRSWWHRRT